MVVRHGHVVAEGWWAPHTPERTRLLYSLSKSFTSTALGFALEEGRLGLDDTVVSHFPELDQDITDPRSRSVTLRHLASMASGHNRDMLDEVLARDPQEPVRGLLLIPPDEEPGSIFAYSQPCTYALAAVIQRAAGMPLSAYLRPRLLDPLGIGEVGWLTWPPAGSKASAACSPVPRTSPSSVSCTCSAAAGATPGWSPSPMSTRRRPGGSTPPTRTTSTGARATATSSGWPGTATAATAPSASSASSSPSRTPWSPPPAAPRPCRRSWTASGTTCSQASAPAGRTPPPTGSSPAPGRPQPVGMRGQAEPTTVAGLDRPAVPCRSRRPWRPGGAAHLGCAPASGPRAGGHRRRVGQRPHLPRRRRGLAGLRPRDRHGDPVPVATSGGWLDDHSLRVEVIFLESPHRMDIACSLPARTAEAAWRHPPLDGGRLQTLHRPR